MVIDTEEADSAPDFVRNRVAIQREYLDQIGDEFDGQVRAVLPLSENELRGISSLKDAGSALFSG